METEIPDKIVEKLKKLMRLQGGAKKIGICSIDTVKLINTL